MATYVIADIHGEYDMFVKMLDKIALKDEDELYILGDIIDRGPHSIKIMKKLMEMPNVICCVGNHEQMALDCMDFLMKQDMDEHVNELEDRMAYKFMAWMQNGGEATMEEFVKESKEDKECLIDFIKDFSLYETLHINGKNYLLVHAGLGNYSPKKRLSEYSLNELVWERPDYNVQYFEDVFVVSGHTPTQLISDNPRQGYIYKNNNHIAIDCGAHFTGGRLAAICLDTGEEFYIEKTE